MPESQQNSGEKTCAIPTQYLPEFSRGPDNQPSSRACTVDDGQKDTRSMELPRGRFRGVRRNILLAHLLHDLSDDRFTGYCKIIHEQGHMVIVLEQGAIILAENQGLSGDVALESVFVFQGVVVDSELHELTVPQLSLALEFNPKSKVNERRLIDTGRDSRIIATTNESSEPDTPGRQISTSTPLTYFIDSTLSLRMKDEMETDPGQEKTIAFEPLEGNSVLFEARQDVRRGILKDAPDLSDRWRFMGTTRRENFSV